MAHILITNDDGIRSHFLVTLIQAIATAGHRVSVAAPASEQSWIGRAMSRRNSVKVEATSALSTWTEEAWAISGTPTDCVNIALSHLLKQRPDAVISGINIGYNTTLPLIYSSGTIAGALEGAAWGLPAIAASQQVDPSLFAEVSARQGMLPDPLQGHLDRAARHVASFLEDLLADQPPAPLNVHNLNYPMPLSEDAPTIQTIPARLELGGLYEETEPGSYRFRYQPGRLAEETHITDREAIDAGQISYSLLDFAQLAQPINPKK